MHAELPRQMYLHDVSLVGSVYFIQQMTLWLSLRIIDLYNKGAITEFYNKGALLKFYNKKTA